MRIPKHEINVLGHKISAQGISPLESRVKAIKGLAPHKTKKEFQSYLDMVNYCRKFIHDLSIICKPLYELLKGEVPNTVISERLGS